MKQYTLSGKTESDKRKERSKKKELNFKKQQIEQLEKTAEKIEDGVVKPEWKKEWWYCNRIKGYPEPPNDLELGDYPTEPKSEYQGEMRELSDSQEFSFDEEYALKRLRKAIESYKNDVNDIDGKPLETKSKW